MGKSTKLMEIVRNSLKTIIEIPWKSYVFVLHSLITVIEMPKVTMIVLSFLKTMILFVRLLLSTDDYLGRIWIASRWYFHLCTSRNLIQFIRHEDVDILHISVRLRPPQKPHRTHSQHYSLRLPLQYPVPFLML